MVRDHIKSVLARMVAQHKSNVAKAEREALLAEAERVLWVKKTTEQRLVEASDLLRELVAYDAKRFDGPLLEKIWISGDDAIAWLESFRLRARAFLEPPIPAARPMGADEPEDPPILSPGDGFPGAEPDCEALCRAAGWMKEGDGGGTIYHPRDFESWKAAASWGNHDGCGRTYDTWEECAANNNLLKPA